MHSNLQKGLGISAILVGAVLLISTIQNSALGNFFDSVFSDENSESNVEVVYNVNEVQYNDNNYAWNGSLSSGDAVNVMNINGKVTVELSSNQEASVRAHLSGSRRDKAALDVFISETDDGLVVCTLYPGMDGDDCLDGDYSVNTKNNDASVSYTLSLPANVFFEGMTVNGSIEAEVGQAIKATTVNGSIKARILSPGSHEDINLTTVNGSVKVYLPAGVNLDVEATTLNGSIFTDFSLAVENGFMHNSIEGEIGSGGADMNLTTVNGSIKILEL